ncbi:MAG TPA: hypothetical protein PK170_03485 [Anaerolineae bacterium]|nr:hypothetical protein [Anaerolineae bacterium]
MPWTLTEEQKHKAMSKFTESDIRAGATGQSYERGASYFRSGAVSDLTRHGGCYHQRKYKLAPMLKALR